MIVQVLCCLAFTDAEAGTRTRTPLRAGDFKARPHTKQSNRLAGFARGAALGLPEGVGTRGDGWLPILLPVAARGGVSRSTSAFPLPRPRPTAGVERAVDPGAR